MFHKFIIIALFHMGFCQQLNEMKLGTLNNILLTVERLEQKLEERDTLLATKLDDLQNQMTAMKASEEEPTKQDVLLQEFNDIVQGEHQIQKELLDKLSSQTQVASLQEILLAELQRTNNETQHQCSSRKQVTNFLDLLTTDECAIDTHNCSSNATCVDVLAEYQCTCLPGYVGDGFTCEDIDECRTWIDSCPSEAECINTHGTHTCTCPIGFIFNGSSCETISCLSPSANIQGLGCVTLVEERMPLEAAKLHCQTLHGRLLEGLTSRDQLDQLSEHFHEFVKDSYLWVGIRNWGWMETGDPIPDSSPLWIEYDPDRRDNEECGGVGLHPSNLGLFDVYCSGSTYSLCQK